MWRKYYSKEIIKGFYKSLYRIAEKKIQQKSDRWVLWKKSEQEPNIDR